MGARQIELLEFVSEVLTIYTLNEGRSNTVHWHDAGPAVLASLYVAANPSQHLDVAYQALKIWLNGLKTTASLGLFGGLAGFLAGVQVASSFFPRLASVADHLREILVSSKTRELWRTNHISWSDYDLISGPTGIILALVTAYHCRQVAVLPIIDHLASLCDQDSLERLRVGDYRDDSQRRWNFERINTGMAHGVTGVAAALRAASEITDSLKSELMVPLKRICTWLVAESYTDARGLRTWSPAGLEGRVLLQGAERRQAWCYGTPGIAWTLWDASRILEDDALMNFAVNAMRSYCDVFDEKYYIDDRSIEDALGICHGAAGVLAIADTFSRYSQLQEAIALRDRLEEFLFNRLDEVKLLAHENMTLLTGASGILAVVLTANMHRREWLSQIGLR